MAGGRPCRSEKWGLSRNLQSAFGWRFQAEHGALKFQILSWRRRIDYRGQTSSRATLHALKESVKKCLSQTVSSRQSPNPSSCNCFLASNSADALLQQSSASLFRASQLSAITICIPNIRNTTTPRRRLISSFDFSLFPFKLFKSLCLPLSLHYFFSLFLA
jgi:hypothetical protein